MYDDLLGPRKEKSNSKPKPKTTRIFWDIDEYMDTAYCYNCGSHAVSEIRSHLTSDHLLKDIRCDTCGCEWQEVWDKDIDLILKEVKCMTIC